ncbi:histidine phosphatase family protein [Hydrogenophaga sp. BPS33]|uniref:histidine phosphatase family protein n=1 Tax=Hydrogenophaga sp. BPS33 TaxID=2651974 RepID=UPI00131F842E|nr:histidine phosphatase family protein [Hydrogenophaga sp. BPS33]QHE85345.1 histidine phosphatase family protein [Hydrogenophaga sp. BPS33]
MAPPTPLNRRRFAQATALAFTPLPSLALPQTPGFWSLLREGGCVLLLRHAQTEPGAGDPPGFALGDCGTQRNLSAAGREQARRMGAAFLREHIGIHQVRSSAWCRCQDTALLAFKQNTVWPALNAFSGPDERDMQTEDVLDLVRTAQAPRNLALVTHDMNIHALTGVRPAMGEILLTRPALQGGNPPLRLLARQSF